MKRPWLPSYNDGAVKCTRLAGWAAMQARTFRERPDSTRGRHLSSYRRTWLNVRFRAAPRGPERPPWAQSGPQGDLRSTSATTHRGGSHRFSTQYGRRFLVSRSATDTTSSIVRIVEEWKAMS